MPAGITRREGRFVAGFALLIALVTSLPYGVAWLAQGEGWYFSGFLFGVEDGYSYLGKLRLGARGLWDFFIFYTPEPHASAPLIFLPYILPGQLVGLFMSDTHPQLAAVNAVVFHILRLIFGTLLIFVLYRFIAVFVRPVTVRRTALVLATFGGGLGVLLPLLGRQPPEWYIPEGFGLLLLLGLPHLALARAALLGGLVLLLASFDAGRSGRTHTGVSLRPLLLAAGCWVVVGLAVPFYLVIVYCILGGWGLAAWLRRRAFPRDLFWRALIAAGLTLPLFVYYVVIFSTNEAFAVWSAQNQLPSPPPLDYLLAYAVLLVPTLLGSRALWRRARRDPRFALPVGWVVIVPVLVYLPLNVQRRLAEAVIVPLALLAAYGVHVWARGRALKRRGRRRGRARLVLLGAGTVTSLLFLVATFVVALNPARPLFRPADELAAFAWLNATAPADAVVLAAVPTGNALPAFTNLRTFMGHGPETLFWPQKTAQVARFFAGDMSAAEQRALIDTFAIRYIVYGPLERADNPDLTAPLSERYTRIYDEAGYQIYAVE